MLGNQALQRLLRIRAIQAKLTVNQPGDKYEQEADRVAEQIVRVPEPAVQRNRTTVDAGRTTNLTSQQNAEVRERVQKELNSADAGLAFSHSEPENFLHDLGSGQPMDAASRMFFENRFGLHFGQVRVHTGKEAEGSAEALNARAHTCGARVVFGSGAYNPSTNSGKKLIAHELTHIVQQTSVPTQSHQITEKLETITKSKSITSYLYRGIQRSTGETGDAAVPEAATTEPDPEQTETAADTGLYTQSTGSMLELIIRKTPQDGVPGEAELTIRMDYIFVTAGTGLLGTELFDPIEFHNLYALGDTSIKMSRLPSPEAASQQLSDQQIEDSNTIDGSGTPLFWNYYNCKITYDYTLTVDPNITLWDAMIWQIQNKQGRGIFYAPFEIEGLREEQDIGSGRVDFIKRKFKELKKAPPDLLESRNRRELRKEAENYYYDTLFRLTRSESFRYRYIFLKMIEDNPETLIGKKIIVGSAYSHLSDDSEITEKLSVLNSSIQEQQDISTSEDTIDIGTDLRTFDNLMQEMFELGETFEHKTVAGIASLNDPNIAVIDPETLSIDESRFTGADIRPESRLSAEKYLQAVLEVRSEWIPELLAHEAGHNAGEVLQHGNPDYQYEQEGLQSSEIGKVRPTKENTIAIINDPLNRKYMEIH